MSWFSRRRKLAIFILTFLVLVIFAYGRKDAFFQRAKKLIEQNLEKNFPCKFSVGKIKAGLFYGLVLEDLKISFPYFNIKVAQSLVDYNIWLNRPDKKNELVFKLQGGQVFFDESRPLLKNLHGEIRLSQKRLILDDIKGAFKDSPRNVLKFYGEITEDSLAITANLEHSKIEDFDILTNATLNLDKKPNIYDNTQKICGTLKTYGSVFNQRPIPELNSSFEIQDDKLRILTCTLGDNYDLRGIVNLSAPFEANLSLNFYEAALNELVAQFGSQGRPDFSGLLNGLIKVTGPLERPKVEGYLEAKEGHIGDLYFVNADINLKGRYPRILIADSRICREEGYFVMEGEMDFTNLTRQNFLDIKLESDKGMLWQGWDITRNSENEVHMSKNIAGDLKVTFDSFAEETAESFENNYTNELGLECKIFGDKVIKLRLRKEEEILGVERKIRF